MEDYKVIIVERKLFDPNDESLKDVSLREANRALRLPKKRVYDLLLRQYCLPIWRDGSLQLKENAETRLIGFGLSGHKEHRIILPYTDFGIVTLSEGKSLETLSKGDVIHVIVWDGKPGLFD